MQFLPEAANIFRSKRLSHFYGLHREQVREEFHHHDRRLRF